MNRTKIEWCSWSVNPIKLELASGRRVNACIKCSEGCRNCYAASLVQRFWRQADGKFPGYSLPLINSGKVVLIEQELNALLRLDKRIAKGDVPRNQNKVFWGDMTDLFGDWVPFEMLDKCFAVMALTPHLIHQVLTKRPERMAEYFNEKRDLGWTEGYVNLIFGRPARFFPSMFSELPLNNPDRLQWPLPNVWLGTSVENQEAAVQRVGKLIRIPAAVHFLSCEPLLGSVTLWEIDDEDGQLSGVGIIDHGGVTQSTPHDPPEGYSDRQPGIDWVICGGESGPGARPMHPAWAKSLRDQCNLANVPFFFKQWGRYSPTGAIQAKQITVSANGRIYNPGDLAYPDGPKRQEAINARDDRGNLTVMYASGKSAADRLLDGREHNEYPEVAA